MIIVRLRGGLGNQLFQYAAARALAVHKSVELKADLYTYTKHPYRKFELKYFNIDLPEASRKEVHAFTGSNPLIRYLNKKSNYFYCPLVCSQPHYHYFEDFLNLPSSVYLSGYWQSEKYFYAIKDIIKSEITPRVKPDQYNDELIHEMDSVESIAVHVRHGDYTTNINYKSFFSQPGREYYANAISHIRNNHPSPKFYFFSDNIPWCRATFKDLPDAVFISHNTGDESYKDLLLISSCKHQIIANSTFSWWGAWLNPNRQKTVIAPRFWFKTSYQMKKEPVYPCRIYNTKDLIPENWICL